MTQTQRSINVAIFGDLHGRLLMPFHLCARWEREHGAKIDYALSVGDAGIFRGVHTMDKASRRFAKKYPEELGFSKFFFCLEGHPAADEVLASTDVDLLFLPGNHEEHAFLEQVRARFALSAEEPVAVDQLWGTATDGGAAQDERSGYGRLLCLPQGKVVTLDGPLDEATWEPAFGVDLIGVNGLDKFTPREAWGAKPAGAIQIMLTHETYKGRLRGCDPTRKRDEFGSERLLELIKTLGPDYHFFGHHHWHYPEVELKNYQGHATRSVGLNELVFHDRQSTISEGCFGILRIDSPQELYFYIVDDDWLQQLSYPDVQDYL